MEVSKYLEWTTFVHCVATCDTNDCRFLLEKLTSSQLVKKFHSFYETRRFIIAFTRAHYLSLSWARSSSPCPTPHFPNIHFSIILPSTPGHPSGLCPSGFPAKTPSSPLLHASYINNNIIIIIIIIIIICVAVSLSVGYTPILACFSELFVFLCR